MAGVIRDDTDAMRNAHQRRSGQALLEERVQLAFASFVQRRGSLVEKKPARPMEDGPCNDQALLFTATQLGSQFCVSSSRCAKRSNPTAFSAARIW